MEIFDFHTHPFTCADDNICSHIANSGYPAGAPMDASSTAALMKALGVTVFAGSVITHFSSMPEGSTRLDCIKKSNETALKLRDLYGGAYIPGIHVHADYPRESCEIIEDMARRGVRLIGELVPYFDGWRADYASADMAEILDAARSYGMVVSFHSMREDAMDAMVEKNPDVVFVAAHPGEYGEFSRHMERMKKSRNYYLDLSGYGIFRHGMLRRAIDLFGAERFVFGSDYPTCNPAMYIGGVMLDPLITDGERELIMAKNAKRLLGL